MAAILSAQEELRASIAVLQQATQNIKREVGRLASGSGVPATTVQGVSGPSVDLDSHKYVAFEDQFRGSADDIRQRVSTYVPLFAGAADVLDIGCGRGEFLMLLREQHVSARGIDLNPSMVDVCREKGLDAHHADALAYLRGQPDASLGGLFAAQVIEHLAPDYLIQLLDAAFDKLRPGSAIVLETINPGCWFAFFESYIRDITHSQPIHPDTLKHLLIASGFQQIDIQYRAPYPEWEKLQPLASGRLETTLAEHVETLNANVEKINRLLFTYLDYAAVGRRP
jgi:SAM-dependent methyltransferase